MVYRLLLNVAFFGNGKRDKLRNLKVKCWNDVFQSRERL